MGSCASQFKRLSVTGDHNRIRIKCFAFMTTMMCAAVVAAAVDGVGVDTAVSVRDFVVRAAAGVVINVVIHTL